MADQGWRGRRVPTAILAALFASACGYSLGPTASGPRGLDRECGHGCQEEGTAVRVEGITADTIAMRVGPGPGKFTLDGGDGVVSREILVEGTGTFLLDVTRVSAPATAAWMRIGTAVHVAVDDDSTLLVLDYRDVTPPGCGGN